MSKRTSRTGGYHTPTSDDGCRGRCGVITVGILFVVGILTAVYTGNRNPVARTRSFHSGSDGPMLFKSVSHVCARRDNDREGSPTGGLPHLPLAPHTNIIRVMYVETAVVHDTIHRVQEYTRRPHVIVNHMWSHPKLKHLTTLYKSSTWRASRITTHGRLDYHSSNIHRLCA